MRAQKRPRPASPSSAPLQCSQNLLSSEQNDDEFALINLSKIRKEVQCPICLDVPQKTRTCTECLHRFCKGCIEESMRSGNHACPLCRTHYPSRRSLREDSKFDALIAVIYGIMPNNSPSNTSSSKSIEKLLHVYPATSHPPAVPKALNEAWSSLCQAIPADISLVAKATGSEGEKAKKKVEELRLHVSTHGDELTRFKLLAEDHKNEVDSLTEELKMSTVQMEELQSQVSTQGAELTRSKLLAEAHKKEVDALTEELKMFTDQVEELQLQVSTQGGEMTRYKHLGEAYKKEVDDLSEEIKMSTDLLEEFQLQVNTQGVEMARFKLLAEALKKEADSLTEELKMCTDQVEELQFQVSTHGAELNRYELLAEAHKKEVDSLTEELKMCTDQVEELQSPLSTQAEDHKKEVDALTEELKMSTDQVDELQLQVSVQDAELARFKLLAEAHKKQVDAMSEELKMSSDQVSRLDKKITELETVKQEQALKLNKLEQLQSENPQLVKECVRRLFRTKGFFKNYIQKLMGPWQNIAIYSFLVDFFEEMGCDPAKYFEKKQRYAGAKAASRNFFNALMPDDLDFPLLHELASLAEPLTLSTLERVSIDENLEMQSLTRS